MAREWRASQVERREGSSVRQWKRELHSVPRVGLRGVCVCVCMYVCVCMCVCVCVKWCVPVASERHRGGVRRRSSVQGNALVARSPIASDRSADAVIGQT